jgi:hypothetical protein
MTTLFLTEKRCFVCGSANRYPLVDLTLRITGTRDLDGRPSHIQRSLVYLWIQRCTACDYCAPDISQGEQIDLQLMKDSHYQTILTDPDFPDTARAFLSYGYIMEKKAQLADAAWAALSASWVCDDNEFTKSSIYCRKKALELFAKAQNAGQEFAPTRIEETIYTIDILRRTGEFTKALKLCLDEIDKEYSDHIIDLLSFEKYLLEKQDTTCHNENEADELEY